jgi:hypothetical protein
MPLALLQWIDMFVATMWAVVQNAAIFYLRGAYIFSSIRTCFRFLKAITCTVCTVLVGGTVCTVLYCTVLHCTVLYCTVLYCTALYCTQGKSLLLSSKDLPSGKSAQLGLHI